MMVPEDPVSCGITTIEMLIKLLSVLLTSPHILLLCFSGLLFLLNIFFCSLKLNVYTPYAFQNGSSCRPNCLSLYQYCIVIKNAHSFSNP